MVERSRVKEQQEKIEKQQHVIVPENTLFKRFKIETVQNYDQK